MDGVQTFELSVPGWRVRGARTAWYAGIGFSVFLAIRQDLANPLLRNLDLIGGALDISTFLIALGET